MQLKSIFVVFLFFIVGFQWIGCASVYMTSRPPQERDQADLSLSLVRVTATRQGFSFRRPWQRRNASTQTAIGVFLKGDRVLITAELVANQRQVEIQKINSSEKCNAQVEVVDYESNLAIVSTLDADFLKTLRPMDLTTESMERDHVQVLQVNPDGDVIPALNPITSIPILIR